MSAAEQSAGEYRACPCQVPTSSPAPARRSASSPAPCRRLPAADLGGVAIAAALERAGVAADDVDHVVVGQVLMAGQGQVPSRQAAVKAGIPMRVPAVNVNKVCLSGLNAIYLADQMIAAGEADVVVAAGIESMTNAPYLADGARCRLPLRQRRAARLDHRRRAVVRVRRLPDGPRHRALHGGLDQPRRPGRLRGVVPRAGRGGDQGGPSGRGDRPGVDRPTQGRPDRRRARRGRAPGDHGREPRARCARRSTRRER